jgi:signal transduction histidine kinase
MKRLSYYTNKLAKKVLIYIVLGSSFLSITSSFIQLYLEFNNNVSAIDQHLNNIENSYLDSIASSLWDFNERLVTQQIDGIVNLPDIVKVEVVTHFDNYYVAGDEGVVIIAQKSYPIMYGKNDIGSLIISVNHEDIYQKLEKKASIILIGEFIKIFVVALFIVIIVHFIIIRHIYRITEYSKELNSSNLHKPLLLLGRSEAINKQDELDELVDAINLMRITIKDEIIKLENAENALLQFSGELEAKVFQRTQELEASNDKLKHSLEDLTLAKDQLVQSEKMASLGQLVAGVAHEVNTPLGICVTAISALKEKVITVNEDVETGKLTKAKLSTTLQTLIQYQDIIENSLRKAIDLIRSFKSVAVEQHTDPELKINLAQHINDVLNTVKTMFKRKNYHITVNVDEDFNLITFPSAWNQILTNFLVNSHMHGFEDQIEGEILIEFTHTEEHLTLIYKDNGKGIEESLKKKIFDPFVTTKRGQGGSGLGLNIVFNLVNGKLNGSIESIDCDKGVIFKVVAPIHHGPIKHEPIYHNDK